MTGTVLVCGVLVIAGLVGIVVPGVPGTALVFLGILVWAAAEGSAGAWTVWGVATACLVAGAVVKYVVPGRRLRAAVPTSTLLAGGAGAVIGFVVVPVVGALVGFPIGVYAAERARVGATGAWPSTREALRAIGVSLLIELAAAVAATAVWVAGLMLA